MTSFCLFVCLCDVWLDSGHYCLKVFCLAMWSLSMWSLAMCFFGYRVGFCYCFFFFFFFFWSVTISLSGLLDSSTLSMGYKRQKRKPRKLTTVSFLGSHGPGQSVIFFPLSRVFLCLYYIQHPRFLVIFSSRNSKKVHLLYLRRSKSLLSGFNSHTFPMSDATKNSPLFILLF